MAGDSNDTSRLSSKDAGFFGNSGVGDLDSLLTNAGDLIGVTGLSFTEFSAGVRSGTSWPDINSISDGSELDNTCSVFTSGTLAIGVVTSASTLAATLFVFVSVALLPGARLLGPRALPLVMWVSSGAGTVFSSRVGSTDRSPTSSLEVPPLPAMGGGPLANMLAKAGLKRSASLLDLIAGAACGDMGAVDWLGLSMTIDLLARRLFRRAIASGGAAGSFGGGGLEMLSDLDRFLRTAIASGGGVSLAELSVLLWAAEPVS